MKKLLIIILLFLCLPSVLGIGLTIPDTRQIFFEPGKHVTINYQVGNTDPTPLHAKVVFDAGELTEYITEPEKELTVPAFSTMPFTLDMTFPQTLQSGLYPIRVQVSEEASVGGMAGLTGVTDIINVISPFEKGYPYGEILVNQYQQPGNPISFAVQVQNIGRTGLQNIKADVSLKLNGQMQKQTTTNALTALAPFEKGRLEGTLDAAELAPGIYTLEVPLSNIQTLTQKIAIGQPTLTVADLPTVNAATDNDFTAKISLDNWATPIQNANIRFHINTLLDYPAKLTLTPGVNELHVHAPAEPGRTGTFKGSIFLTGELVQGTYHFTADVHGSSGTGGVGFRKTPGKAVETAPEPEQAATPVEQPKPAKNQTFLIILLIASFAIFAFALGRYMARRKNNEQPPITPTQPPANPHP